MERLLMKAHKMKLVSGYSLVEVLITVLVVSIGIIGLIRFQTYLGYDDSLSQQRATAVTLATSQIETLSDYQVLTAQTGYVDYASIASGSSTTTSGGASYTITWTVTPSTTPLYKQIDVVVSWTDRNGTAQSIRMVTYIAGTDPSYSAVII